MPEAKPKKVTLCYKCINCGHFLEEPSELLPSGRDFLGSTKRICTCVVTEKEDHTVFGMMDLAFVKVIKE